MTTLSVDSQDQLDGMVILTSSDSDDDVLDTYNLHASGYIKKPVKLEDFKRVVKAIKEYWFVLCRLQPQER